MDDPRTPPEAASDKPPGEGRAEPLDADVSRAGEAVPAAPSPVIPPASPGNLPSAGTPAPGAAPPKPPEHARTPPPPAGPPDPAPPPTVPPPRFIAALQAAAPDAIERVAYWVGDWTVILPAARLLDVAAHLRDAEGASFDFCSDITAVDWPPRAQRFDVVYCLYSTRLRHRVRMKVRTGDREAIPSVTSIWPAANWLEREVFDLFGIQFDGHPDLRRILMPDDWQGHPQRKDYPLEGPGEMLLENPIDWLKVKQAREIE
jgi:NADH-quinone oxidoreductase subunit C